MRLDLELVKRGLSESRTEAQELIEKKSVFVNGEISIKQTKQVSDEDEIMVTGRRKYVSRGGEKLEGVLLDIFGSEEKAREFCREKAALDIGSSTGGFTDCLLLYGVKHVDAVDVGTQQLHATLREDSRISLFEQTDIRSFTTDTAHDIIVADLSFISLEDVYQKVFDFGNDSAVYLLLIKPQFEVGRGNTKKGIVKDMVLVEEILSKYKQLITDQQGKSVRVYPCRIQGGDGNQEYFLYVTQK
jgi:23S rRNA (cytidine1920-2'-O)/16S rRNA (cytidine1409-2'-O)-methyltransferase